MYWAGACCERGSVQCLCMMGCRTIYEDARAEQWDGRVVGTKELVGGRV